MKVCRRCGDRPSVRGYHGLCDNCDSEVIICSVCREEQWTDDGLCRHVFRDSNYEWQGSGNCFVEQPSEHVRESLFKLFELMPDGFAADLKTAIHSKKFHTFLIAPLIGSGGLLELHGMPARDGIRFLFGWGDYLLEIGSGGEDEQSYKNAEESADGYSWLASLYDGKTPDANAITVAWIDQYLSRKPQFKSTEKAAAH